MTDYPDVTINTAAGELNRLHGVIESKLRSTVQDAIRAGQILAQVKDRLPHGDFLPWLKANCAFSQQTASRYMRLNTYHDKLPSVSNLQEAYQQIENIEKQQKQAEERKAKERVHEYRKTGVKPDGWRRGTDDKIAEEEAARAQRSEGMRQRAKELDERIQAEEAKREELRQRKEEESTQQDAPRGFWIDEEILNSVSESAAKRSEFKTRLTLSQDGETDPFVDALIDYLETLADDNRRIEACSNIIKVARGIISDLYRRTA